MNINKELLVTAYVNIFLLIIATSSLAIGNIVISGVIIFGVCLFLIVFNIKMSQKIVIDKDKRLNVVLLIMAVIVGTLVSAFLIMRNILHII